ncbi:MAG: Uma2 family endonuclease [Planctomycetaceae bacterium]|nr:Uma2 family endonuclease [Planctomycetaceae bacterium]
MPTLVYDPLVEKHLIDERRRNGLDRWDEVWEGAYVIMPSPNDEHQDILDNLVIVLKPLIQTTGLGVVRSTINVSDRFSDWKLNFRIPDLAIFLKGSSAENCGTHWYGGPDFTIEIVSPGDRSREKLAFYESIGTKELLLIDRDPWQLELFRLSDGGLQSVGTSSVKTVREVESQTLPLTWSLLAGDSRPQIIVRHVSTNEQWQV